MNPSNKQAYQSRGRHPFSPLGHPPTSVSMKENTLSGQVKNPGSDRGTTGALSNKRAFYFTSTKILPFRPGSHHFSGPRKRDRPATQASDLGDARQRAHPG